MGPLDVLDHDPQVRICHQRIGAGAGRRTVKAVERPEWCNLPASMWCLIHDFYVCEMHAHSRHRGHPMQSVADERAAKQHPESDPEPDPDADTGERRKGDRRLVDRTP